MFKSIATLVVGSLMTMSAESLRVEALKHDLRAVHDDDGVVWANEVDPNPIPAGYTGFAYGYDPNIWYGMDPKETADMSAARGATAFAEAHNIGPDCSCTCTPRPCTCTCKAAH